MCALLHKIAFTVRSTAKPCADCRLDWILTRFVSCLIGLSLIRSACGDLAQLIEGCCFRCLLGFWPWVATSDPLFSWQEDTFSKAKQVDCKGWDLGLCEKKKLQSFTYS